MTHDPDFTHLHLHSDLSSLDGAATVEAYVTEAAARGHRAIALTDHGTVRGLHDLVVQTAKVGIKPIFGVEVYVARDMLRRGLTPDEKVDVTKGHSKNDHKALIKDLEEREGIRDRWHTTLWAFNDVGLRNLWELTSASWIEGYYYKPRVDLACLVKHSEGIFLATGCLSSPINDLWLQGRKREALEYGDMLYAAFGENMLLELQPHNIPAQATVNAMLIAVARKKRWPKARFIATQDAHYLNQEDAGSHEVHLCIGTGAKMSSQNRFKFDGDEFHFRTRAEMEDAFDRHHAYIPKEIVKIALDNTVTVSEACEAKIVLDKMRALLPEVDLPPELDEVAYLRKLCIDGITWRDIPGRAAKLAEREGLSPKDALARYTTRLKHELGVITKMRFTRYFLKIREIFGFARGAGIQVGPGRGSSAGSLVAFLLGIVSVDPLEHALLFERFIAPGRMDLPDVDMDFEHHRRGEILEWLIERHGRNRVSQIATVGRLTGKSVVKDVSRVFEVPFGDANSITQHILERDPGDARAYRCVEDSITEVPQVAAFAARYPEVMVHASKLEGLSKVLGVHAAGVVVSPVPLTELLPLETRKPTKDEDAERVIVTAFDMGGVQDFGLVKMDVLGLTTLTTIRICVEEARAFGHDVPDLETINLDDEETLRGFTEGDFVGVFQFDSHSSRRLCEGVVFTRFDDIATMTAVNRPGATRSGLADLFITRKKDGIRVEDLSDDDIWHGKMRDITRDTLGVLVYQEHTIRVFRDVAGYSPEAADKMRKLIGKREGAEAMEANRVPFLEGVARTTPDLSDELANDLFKAVAAAGAYQFNKSHATAYGVIAYWCMWLKIRYPLEWALAMARTEKENAGIRRMARDMARRRGVAFLPPDVSTCSNTFVIDRENNAVRASLLHIAGVGNVGVQSLAAAQPFTSFGDLLTRCGKANRSHLAALARAGALDALSPNRYWTVKFLLENDKRIAKVKKSPAEALQLDREAAIAAAEEADWSEGEKMLEAAKVSPLAFGASAIEPWAPRIAQLSVPLVDAGDEDFFSPDAEGALVWMAVNVLTIDEGVVGDYGDQDNISEKEKERRGFGKPQMRATAECESGVELRMKVDYMIFPGVVDIMKKGAGLLILGVVAPKWTKVDILAAWDLNDEEWLAPWEGALTGNHPTSSYPWTDEAQKTRMMAVPGRGKGKCEVTGIVVGLRTKKDKNGRSMADFVVVAARGQARVVAFSGAWGAVFKNVEVGAFVTVRGRWSDDGDIILDDRAGEVVARTRTTVRRAT